MASTDVHPVIALRLQAAAVRAALADCVAEPDARAVHRLRTSARRLEALLDLLRQVDGLPSYKRKAARLLRRLRKARRAAGKVRDLDVQRQLLQDHMPAAAVRSLHKVFDRRRQKAQRKLARVLEERQMKIGRSLDALLAALAPAETAVIRLDVLLMKVEKDFRSDHAVGMRDPSAEQLHQVRKAAKAARYAAETSTAPSARAAAKRYADLQHSGGAWHDWYTLAAIAGAELGERDAVTARCEHTRDEHLATYRAALTSRLKNRPAERA